jgi:hypothetical protein
MVVIRLFLVVCDLQRVEKDLCPILYLMSVCKEYASFAKHETKQQLKLSFLSCIEREEKDAFTSQHSPCQADGVRSHEHNKLLATFYSTAVRLPNAT